MTGLLIFIGLALITLNVLAIKKQNKSFNGTLESAIDNIGDYDIRIGELRRDFSESILELQSEIMEMKEVIENNNRLNKNYYAQLGEKDHDLDKNEKEYSPSTYVENINIIEENENKEVFYENKTIVDECSTSNNTSNSGKVEEIKRLFSEGLSVDEISEILHLGKGEVLLIKDLYIR